MSTLFARMSLALVVIIGISGTAFFVVDRIGSDLYYQELTQRLNAPIAMYVTGERTLIRDGNPDIASLADLAQQAMIINPTAEIYLLDTDGNVLGHGLPEESVLRGSIDLGPVRELIAGEPRLPLLGDDPRSNDGHKVFSASEVRADGNLEGYLYVILGGQAYELLANDIMGTYTQQNIVFAIIAIVLATTAIGVVVFRLLTRRLNRLNEEMRKVSESGFTEEPELSPAENGGDEIDEISNAFLDMSARIHEQLEQLKENDKLRRELVSNISHDLRTPLSAMQGFLETLIIKDESLPKDERDRYLKTARRHTLRLNELIGDLFELSKLDAASVTPNMEAFSVHELLQDVTQEFQLEAEGRNIRIGIQLDADNVLTVGDIGLIQRVLENLVRNAIHFTPADGEIILSVAKKPASVAVAVSDTGCGIPENEIPRIFERYYSASDNDNPFSGSSGLGLAIVKRILDLHDSQVTVTSKINNGTRFEFELPLYQRAA
jgi:signal transduction histidine kinase